MTFQSKLILSALGAALLATPALAAPQSAQAYGPAAANSVVVEGVVIGADPDLQIRSALVREWGSLHGE
jgi:hypothetical protein